MRMVLFAIAIVVAAPAAAQTELNRPAGNWQPPGHDLAFPETLGELKRGRILQYGQEDWSVTYDIQRDSRFHILTIYFYRRPPNACGGERFDAMASIFERQRNVVTLSEEPVSAPRGRAERAWLMRYTLDWPQGELFVPVTSDLYTYCNSANNWAVKYRSTGNLPELADQADAMVRTLNWPSDLID